MSNVISKMIKLLGIKMTQNNIKLNDYKKHQPLDFLKLQVECLSPIHKV